MIPILMTIGKTVGQVLVSMALSILTGKTFKSLLVKPIEWLSRKTKTVEDDIIVENIKEDLGLPHAEESSHVTDGKE